MYFCHFDKNLTTSIFNSYYVYECFTDFEASFGVLQYSKIKFAKNAQKYLIF